MRYVYGGVQITFNWTIWKKANTVKEDFDQSELRVLLYGPADKYYIPVEITGEGDVAGQLPESLPAGVYSMKAFWTKRALRANGRVLESEQNCFIAITYNETEVESTSRDICLHLQSAISTYGKDGLSAYEIAVLLGQTQLKESEWSNVNVDLAGAEHERVLAEEARDTAEAGRVTAEQGRVSAETGRVSAEESRVAAEASRVEAESARVAAETARGTAETARENAEDLRELAEKARDAAESSRRDAEDARELAEQAREDAFDAHEAARQAVFETSEASRAQAFSTSESARTAAFNTTQAARQATFESSEEDRTTTFGISEAERAATFNQNENARAVAEAGRVSAEQGRVSAEQGRVSAESSRVSAEAGRVSAEASRVTAEEGRLNAEASRVTAEEAREAAEEIRQENYEKTIKYIPQELTSLQQVKAKANIGLPNDTVFDVSKFNEYEGELHAYADLTAALEGLPAEYHVGGVSIKFINSVSGKYETWTLMDNSWSSDVADWQGVDEKPTAGSKNLVKSGGVQNELALGAVYDVSAKNPTAGPNNDGKFESLYALLSDANLNTLIPTSVRKGGMSIKFVQTSDNKYAQYRLIRNIWSTMLYDWVSVVNDVVTGGVQNMLSAEMGKQLAQNTNNIIGTFEKQNVAAMTNVKYPYTIKAGARIYNYGVRILCASNSSLDNRFDILSGQYADLSADVSYIQTYSTAGDVSFKIVNNEFVAIDENINKRTDNKFINLFNPQDADVAIGKYLLDDGSLAPSASYNTSGFIPVKGNTNYYSRIAGKQFRFINYYTEEKSIISQEGEKTVFTTPSNCAYVRITFYVNDYDYAQVTEGTYCDFVPYTPIAEYLFEDAYTRNQLPIKKIGKNKLDKTSFAAIIGVYLNSEGSIAPSSSYCVTGFIPFNEGKMIASYDGNPIIVGGACICYYDSNYTCIGSHTIASTKGVATWFDGVAYVRFSITNANLDYAQVEVGEHATNYEPYGYYIPDSDLEPRIALPAPGGQRQSAQLADGETLDMPLIYCRYAQSLSAIITGTIPQNGSVIVGRGRNITYGYYAEITPTEITFAGTTYQHGLTLGERTFFCITTDQKLSGKMILISNNGGMFEQDIATSMGGAAYVQNNTGISINVELALELKKVTSPSWLFGDSYFSMGEIRWIYYPVMEWGFDNYLIDNLSGGTAEQMLVSLRNLCLIGNPKYIVWCLGMNGGTDSEGSVNTSWLSVVLEVLSICKNKNIIPILATIPSVPNQPHEALNDWVRNSGYRYIDFAKAVNAQPDGIWDTGLLSSDNVHPTAAGAKVLASRVLVDFPEITLD